MCRQPVHRCTPLSTSLIKANPKPGDPSSHPTPSSSCQQTPPATSLPPPYGLCPPVVLNPNTPIARTPCPSTSTPDLQDMRPLAQHPQGSPPAQAARHYQCLTNTSTGRALPTLQTLLPNHTEPAAMPHVYSTAPDALTACSSTSNLELQDMRTLAQHPQGSPQAQAGA